MQDLILAIGQAISSIDSTRPQNGRYRPGIGPFGEPQLVRKIKDYFRDNFSDTFPNAVTRRNPDFLIPNIWAIEFKIVRPYGDNDLPAENWSVNLLHPYQGNQSSIGDIYKLTNMQIAERKGIVLVCYEHNIPRINLEPLLVSFETIARDVCNFNLSERHQTTVEDLVHPVHQVSKIYGWEIL